MGERPPTRRRHQPGFSDLVSICTRQRPFPQQVLTLHSYKCQELANHYLGFNGWSSCLITLQNISGFEEEENKEEEVRTSPMSQCLKYLCIQELIIPQHGIRTRGVGVAEPHVDASQELWNSESTKTSCSTSSYEPGKAG
ncbi:RAD52 motif-containing protein 1-like isoform X2 [Hemicordylus capensis]|uniref:RAD52 motif-containing protein 1-like isoform X2 n=1 Tax=Hemicordylus capensis TaxID=884348 RepID=UPI0023033638|nr:RAD52 motif-containing protein 1-like isoform X2 [Hemicordylus capensis]